MKKLFLLFIAVIVLISAVSCGKPSNGDSSVATGSESEARFSPFLPDEYKIVFEVTDYSTGEATNSKLTIAKSGEYRFYSTDDDLKSAYLFKAYSDETYSQLIFDEESGKFSDRYADYLKNGLEGYTSEDAKEAFLIDVNQVNGMSMSYSSLLTHYSGCASKLVEVGTETVAGRECTVYELDPSLMGNLKNLFFVSKYYIDKEYEICLKYTITEENKRSSYDFVCTDFSVSDISIPVSE